MSRWQPIRVAIEQGDSELDALGTFNAYTRGDDWNGWAVPYFTQEEAMRVAAWTRAMKERFPEGEIETVAWDDVRGAFIMEDPQYPHLKGQPIPDEDIVGGFRPEGLDATLYGIGSYKWTWEEVVGP